MSFDRYFAEISGSKVLRLENFEACVATVRGLWAEAYAEGSTGAERTFFNPQPSEEALLIAHAWPVRRHPAHMWLRVKIPPSVT